jgi:hypothetical protein
MPNGHDRVLVLSALSAGAESGSAVSAAIKSACVGYGLEVEFVDVVQADIRPCRGCGSCGGRTPGHCVLQDDMQSLYPRIICSRIVVLAGPLLFGAHHSAVKRVLDRFQPFVLPLYVVRAREMNFRPRYSTRPALLGVGLRLAAAPSGDVALAEEEAGAYAELIERHALNMASPGQGAVVVTAGGEEEPYTQAIARVVGMLVDEHDGGAR